MKETSSVIDATTPLAVTLGEPAGIGPDVTLTLFDQRSKSGLPPFVVFGDAGFLRRRAERLRLRDCAVREIQDLATTFSVFESALPVLQLEAVASDCPGVLEVANGEIVIQSIRKAVTAARSGAARAVITAPINKANLYAAGFRHQGHTEFLAALCADGGTVPQPVMMLAHNDRRAIPVTRHIALRDVFSHLTPERIVNTVRVTNRDLQEKFGIATPRIAVTGLNPHAGEHGAMGAEEHTIIQPAIDRLHSEFGIAVDGPLPADSAFAPHLWMRYDVIVAMYHDQALIPVKTAGFDVGVNVTLGLPIIRTSPDHGTALELAGSGTASATSMHEAIVAADQLSKTMCA